MRNRIRFHFILFFCPICGLLTSCLEDINLDTGEKILNVYCVLGQGPEQEMELSYIAPTGGTRQPAGEGVSITLSDEGAPAGQFSRVSETKWNLDYTPQEGHTYRLEIEVPGEETLTAETRFPTACTLQGVFAVMVGETSPYYIFGIELDSPEDQILWCYYEEQREGPITAYVASDHPGIDGRGETIYPFDIESPIYKNKFEGRFSPFGCVLPSDVLDSPVFLHEKVLRIVHPADFSRPVDKERMRIYHEMAIDDHVVPVEDQSGRTGMFCFGGVKYSGPYAYGPMVICSVSSEYDNYLSDFYYHNQDDGDFAYLVYRQNHYSNIQNGTGIFGAFLKYHIRSSYYGSL